QRRVDVGSPDVDAAGIGVHDMRGGVSLPRDAGSAGAGRTSGLSHGCHLRAAGGRGVGTTRPRKRGRRGPVVETGSLLSEIAARPPAERAASSMAWARDREPGSKTGSEKKHQCAFGLLRAPSRTLRLPGPKALTSPEFLVALVAGTVISGSKGVGWNLAARRAIP